MLKTPLTSFAQLTVVYCSIAPNNLKSRSSDEGVKEIAHNVAMMALMAPPLIASKHEDVAQALDAWVMANAELQTRVINGVEII